MRGGARVKEALGFVTLAWKHPVLTGMLLLIFTPPFFSLVVYFSPVLISTALCVVALVSVGSQMEKIKSEGGPGQQLETRLGCDYGVSAWMRPRDHSTHTHNHTRSDPAPHYYGENTNRHGNSYANIHVVPAPPSSWTDSRDNTTTTATARLRPDPVTPAAAERDEDWLDTWVKEYESRPGWGEQQDQQPFRTPAAILTSTTTSQAPARKENAPLKRDIRDQNRPELVPAPASVPASVPASIPASVPAAVPAPVMAARVAAPVSVSVVTNRQKAASRLLPPPPTTSTSRSLKEVVVSVKVTDYHPRISTLAPIRTGKETTKDRQVNRIGKTAQEILAVPVKVEVPANAQALRSIEKPLHTGMGESQSVAPVADVKNATPKVFRVTSPGLAGTLGKGVGVEAPEEKTENTTAADIAGETPLLRHLKTSRSKKHSQSSSAFSPLPSRASRGVMAEKVLPPPQFSPRLLQSLQPLPPKGFSPRPLPNLSTVPLGNPVEKIPQWVYDGIPKERAAKQATKAEMDEEKHVRAFEQAVKVLSHTRRRTHARRPVPIQADFADGLQEFESPRLDKSTERSSRRTSPHTPASRASSPPHRASPPGTPSELLHARISEDLTAAGAPHKPAERALPIPRASATPPPRTSPLRTSPEGASAAATTAAAASPSKALLARTASPPRASGASSPQRAPIAASFVRASSPRTATTATSPRPASKPLNVPLAAPPRGASGASSPRSASILASSPQKAPIAASPRRASRASSPRIDSSPWPASVASPAPQMQAPAPQKQLPSVPSSPSLPHPRRHKQQSSKLGSDKAPSIQIEGSNYYDTPGVEKEDSIGEDYVPIEKEVPSMVVVDANGDEGNALHHGRRSHRSSNSRRRLEPRRVVTSEDAGIFCLPMRNGQAVNYVDSSSTTDDERESVTPTTSRRLVRRTIKPLVWRSRSVQAHDVSD